jgi:peptidoglycan/xylan/chitin deacetylase (PgdA/CDA1 family)
MKRSVRRGVQRLREAREFRGVWADGARAALSITFDDARASQPRVAAPLFERLGVRATFFVLPEPVSRDSGAWKEMVAAGHEMGNHTVNHPCSGNFPWSRGRALEEMTVADVAREVDDAERQIEDALGVAPTVFAYPCGHTFVGRGRSTTSLVPFVAERFVAGRTFNDLVANAAFHCDLAQVSAFNADHVGFEQLRPALEAALADRAWLVIGGHEIGHDLADETTRVDTLEAIVGWCREHDVWIDTVGAVATRVSAATDQDVRRAR